MMDSNSSGRIPPGTLSADGACGYDAQEASEKQGVDRIGRIVKLFNGIKLSKDGVSKTSELAQGKQRFSRKRLPPFRNHAPLQNSVMTEMTVNGAISQLKKEKEVNDIALILNSLSADQRNELSQNKDTPKHCRAMLNKRIIRDRLHQYISDRPPGLFRASASKTEIDNAIELMEKSALPDAIIKDPISCGHLFKNLMSKDKVLKISSFKNVMTTENGKKNVNVIKFTKKLEHKFDKMFPVQKDNLAISLSVIKTAYESAPDHPSGESKIVARNELLGIFGNSIFIIPEPNGLTEIPEQEETVRALVKAILNNPPKKIGF